MKISGSASVSESVSIGSTRDLLSKLAGVKIGDTVSAEIITRKGSEALLDIGGHRIRADFLRGVPEGNHIDLILTEKNGKNIVFALTAGRGLFREFSVFTNAVILSDEELNSFSIQNLVRFISSTGPGLFDISLFLLGLKRNGRKARELTDILKNMMDRGAGAGTLSYFSLLTSGRFSSEIVIPYLYFMMLRGKKPDFMDENSRSAMDDEIESLLDEIDDGSLISLIDRIVGADENETFSDVVVLPDEDGMSICEYIFHGESCMVNFNLSGLGRICVLIKSLNKKLIVNFFTENQDVLNLMKEKNPLLLNLMEQNGIKKTDIGYYSMKKIVDKIHLWSSDFIIKSGFDVRI